MGSAHAGLKDGVLNFLCVKTKRLLQFILQKPF